MTISMSSPSVSRDSPPLSRTRSRLKTPNAPEMISRPFIVDQAMRASEAHSLRDLARPGAAARRARKPAKRRGNHRAVRNPDGAADRDHVLGVSRERLDNPLQRVPFEQRVRIDDRDQLHVGDVQARVDRVRAATVLLPQNTQPRVDAADVVASDCLGRDLHPVTHRQFDEIEGAVERSRCLVLRSVVDDHDLERVVVSCVSDRALDAIAGAMLYAGAIRLIPGGWRRLPAV